MSLATDLLGQARYLAQREPRRPRQASLRRAVSSAYYALFHQLCAEAAASITRGTGGSNFRGTVTRAFTHSEMGAAAKSFAGGSMITPFAKAVGSNVVPSDLVQVASAFVDLQQARHEADYDVDRAFSRGEVVDLLELAESAFDAWTRVRGGAEARAFLLALLVFDRLKRR